MKVLFVNQTSQVSGAERSLLALLGGLAGEVTELLACPPGELNEEAARAGIETVPIRGTRASFRLHPLQTSRGLADIAASALALRRLVARWRPDVVHANTTRAALLALLWRARGGPPVIAHIRDWVPEGRFGRAVLGFVGRRADAVVANSRFVAGLFEGMALRRPVVAIHNPVDLASFDPARTDGPATRRALGIDPGAVVLAVVAQITPWKAQDDTIRTAAALAATGHDVELALVGSAKFAGAGTQYDNVAFERDLHRLAEELGIAARVHFLGEREDVAAILAAVDVLLLPSWQEAFGRIAVEAMAMGVPVAATAAGGPAEIVREGIDGLILPPRQPEAWARALAPLVESPERRREMGGNGRRRATEFGIDAHAAAVLGLYRDLLGAG